MNNNINIIPSEKKYKGAPPLDSNINLTLEKTSRELIEGDRSVPLNSAQRFDKERQNISIYRLYGKIQPFIDNAFSGTANQGASQLIYNLYTVGGNIDYGISPLEFKGYPAYSEFDFIRKDVDESVGDETNWNVYVTIPTSCLEPQPMTYVFEDGATPLNFFASDGIPFHVTNVTKGGRQLIQINCGAKHGLKVGEYVKLKIDGYTFVNNNDTYPVYSVGNGKRKSNGYIYSIYVPSVNLINPITPNSVGTFKRQLIKSDPTSISNYYIIEHEVITNVKDYTLNKCAFSKGVFKRVDKFQGALENADAKEKVVTKSEYPTYLYSFTKDINVKKYLDNLQRPITTLYITIFLRNNLGYFNYLPIYGWGWNHPFYFEDTTISANEVRGGVSSPQTKSGVVVTTNGSLQSGEPLHPGDKLRGAFTEYNVHELKERTISEIQHTFNFNSDIFETDTGTNSRFSYKPHYKVPIRTYSDYIESGDPRKIANIPNYATYFEIEKIWKWRDIYDIGFIEGTNGVDYPFLNAAHYPKTDINFFVNRQVRADAFKNINYGESVGSGATDTQENILIDGCE